MELKLYKKDKYLRVIKKYKQHQKLLKQSKQQLLTI
jgi:hypothetical protein